MEYGIEHSNIDEFWLDLCRKKPEIFTSDQRPIYEDFKRYLREFFAGLLCREKILHSDNAFFVGVEVNFL